MNKRQEQPSTERPSTEQPRETGKPRPEQETAPTQLSPKEILRRDLISAKKDGRSPMLLKIYTEKAHMIEIGNIYKHLQKQIQRRDEVSTTLEEWGVDNNLIDSIFSILSHEITHPRLFGHIHRLLTSENPYEIAFGIAIATNWNAVFSPSDKCKKTILGESDDTCWWWTLGVYLFDKLRNQFRSKITDGKPLYLLRQWAETAKAYSAPEEVTLAGLEQYNFLDLNEPYFTLGKNPEGPSHQFARQEASRLIQEVDIFKKVWEQEQPEA